MGKHQPRVPVEPLLTLTSGKILGPGGLVECTGFTDRAIQRWKRDAAIPIYTADKVAIALGRHPAEIWPEWDRA